MGVIEWRSTARARIYSEAATLKRSPRRRTRRNSSADRHRCTYSSTR